MTTRSDKLLDDLDALARGERIDLSVAEVARDEIERLRRLLRLAVPYVRACYDEWPERDGGAEALRDLEAIRAGFGEP